MKKPTLTNRVEDLEERDREGAILYLDLRTRCSLIEKAILAEDPDAIQRQVNDLKAVCLRKFTLSAQRDEKLHVAVGELEDKLTTMIGELESKLNLLHRDFERHKHLLPSGWTDSPKVFHVSDH